MPRLFSLLLLSVAFGPIGCSVRPNIPLGQIPPAVRPAPVEVAATRSIVQSELGDKSGYKLSESGADYKRVKTIVDKLARAAGAYDFTYPVIIADAGKDVNAMAVNDNTMVVYKELLRKVPSDDELATVISHEVAHIVAGHGKDTTSKEREGWVSVGSTVLGSMASIGASAAGADYVSDIAGSATEGAANLIGTGAVVRAYDRKLEYEADQVGLMLMGKAGYNPVAAISFWNKSQEIFGGDTGGIFLSTHPSSGNRTARLQEALPKAQEYYAEWKKIEELEPVPAPKMKKKK